MNICIYGTVYNSVNTIQNTKEALWAWVFCCRSCRFLFNWWYVWETKANWKKSL